MVISHILHEGVAMPLLEDLAAERLEKRTMGLTVLSDPVPAMSSDESVVRFSELPNNVPATTSNESWW